MRSMFCCFLLALLAMPSQPLEEPVRADGPAASPTITVVSPMAPPTWALLERELLRANAAACREFYARYFDERGYLQCVERWGGDDGPDDAIENCTGWPILHALGAPDDIRDLYTKAWEGHLRQFTAARTTQVPFARDGMYYKEFPVQFDWLHNSEGLTVFSMQGLSDPKNSNLLRRARRYAGFYMNEDPGAPIFDPKHQIIRSMFNGSRGPLLRKATALDWAGDPIEVKDRFRLLHGEQSYEQMLAHFKDYNDIIGDTPLNLMATTLPLNAYLLTNDVKYKKWLLDYVSAWCERMRKNDDIIPTNIGLDGTIGGDAGGKWYGGVYGWGFSVIQPQTGRLVHRNIHHHGLIGFGNAYLLTGDDRFLNPWRRMIERINREGKHVDGRMHYPHMHGDKGWYQFTPEKYSRGALELWYWSMRPDDLTRLSPTGWIGYLQGKDPGYPEAALRQDFASIRQRVAGMRADTTTPDTRLADDPLRFNPATVQTLVQLMLGGLYPGNTCGPLHCRVRYFDPVGRRAGLPQDVGALVEKLTGDSTELLLVNLGLKSREVVVQAGGYAEHRWTSVRYGGRTVPADARNITVRLEPGAGASLLLGAKRYTQSPTLMFPWDRKE